MKKFLLLLSMAFSALLLSAQDLKPMPDCNEMKDKISSVIQSFDKLLETFKKELLRKEEHRNVFTSDFEICGDTGLIVEDTITKIENGEKVFKYKLSFHFSYAAKKFNAPSGAFPAWAERTLGILEQLLGDWEFDRESESNGAMTYYTFSQKNKDRLVLKKEVELELYDMDDGFSFNLNFIVSNYYY